MKDRIMCQKHYYDSKPFKDCPDCGWSGEGLKDNIIASDYKGKWFILMDKDKMDEFDNERKEINVDYVTKDGLTEHVGNCLHYGIPAYVGNNKELNDRIEIIYKTFDEEDE